MTKKKVVPKSKFTEWIAEGNGHEYYIGNFDRLKKEIDYCIKGNSIILKYKNYQIMQLELVQRQLYIRAPYKRKTNDIVQDKLIHEYVMYFNNSQEPFKITQTNFIEVEKYINVVTDKIEKGFTRYEELFLERELTGVATAFIKIEIDNAFSLGELNELIQAYDKLYSIISNVSKYGLEEVLAMNQDQVLYSQNMVLESIHIGSKGDIIAAGFEAIASFLSEMVNLALESDRRSYEEKKAELEAKLAEEKLQIQRRQDVFQLIQMLDKYFEMKENGTNPVVGNYVEQEIMITMERIERLQGTKHINIIA